MYPACSALGTTVALSERSCEHRDGAALPCLPRYDSCRRVHLAHALAIPAGSCPRIGRHMIMSCVALGARYIIMVQYGMVMV